MQRVPGSVPVRRISPGFAAVSCVANSEVLREDSDCADSAGRGSACHEQAATLVSTANVATSISALVRRI